MLCLFIVQMFWTAANDKMNSLIDKPWRKISFALTPIIWWFIWLIKWYGDMLSNVIWIPFLLIRNVIVHNMLTNVGFRRMELNCSTKRFIYLCKQKICIILSIKFILEILFCNWYRKITFLQAQIYRDWMKTWRMQKKNSNAKRNKAKE